MQAVPLRHRQSVTFFLFGAGAAVGGGARVKKALKEGMTYAGFLVHLCYGLGDLFGCFVCMGYCRSSSSIPKIRAAPEHLQRSSVRAGRHSAADYGLVRSLPADVIGAEF